MIDSWVLDWPTVQIIWFSMPLARYWAFLQNCILSGCKRPIRLFFSPLTIPETEPASFGRNPPAIGGLAYVYRVADAKLPHRAVLQKLGCRDLGACGIWNQFEFCLFLLAIAPMDTWKFFMMDDVAYESCDRMCLVSIGRQCWHPKFKGDHATPRSWSRYHRGSLCNFRIPTSQTWGAHISYNYNWFSC